ncbi:MAG: LytTR family DNA-binding domain-containing protein [Bacteroidales bacterium]
MIRCLIVDDEPPARELLSSYVARLEDMKVMAQCGNALEAFSALQRYPVDLMFLDIQMPKMTGLELVRSLKDPPKIVLTTAYKDYACEGFDLDVMDYLVKPISFERFLRTVDRYHKYRQSPQPREAQEEENANPFDHAYLFIKVNKEQVKVFLKEILYVEGLKDYIRVVTTKQSYVTYNRLTYMEEVLPDGHFVRIHKSYIVALRHLDSYGTDSVRIAGQSLPVGRSFKQKFQEELGRLHE